MSIDNSGPPELSADAYRLRVDGLVGQVLELGLADIHAMEAVTQMRTLECISNPAGGSLIGNAVWKGVRLRAILERAAAHGSQLTLESADGYHTGIELDLAMHPDSLLVYEMNGRSLPADHGYPLRCLFPGRYGQKQPKWLTHIRVQDERHTGHWEAAGWSDVAALRINSRIDQPGRRATVRGPEVEIRGVAFAGLEGVASVAVSTDDGQTWHRAEVTRAPQAWENLVWTEWRYLWRQPEPGNHVVWAKARDGNGLTQSRPRLRLLEGTFPDGTSDMHTVSVFVEQT
jgi:DMSO/TMAO reductase YedYZ molybdopterin-dependent catalytic subunit